MNAYHLVSTLGPCGGAKQVSLLAPALAASGVRVTVGVLDTANGFFTETIQSTGVEVVPLPLRNVIDVAGLRRVRQAVAAANPDAVHAWGPLAVRVSRVVPAELPLVASAAAAPGGGLAGWLNARQLRTAGRVVAATWAEAERYRRIGVHPDRLTRIAPAVAPAPLPADPVEVRQRLGVPRHSRLIVAAGGCDSVARLKYAVWAFDMLRYDAADLHLVLCGDGPGRAGVAEFARALAFDDFRIAFAGNRADLPAILSSAEVVWVTHERGGVNLALEAMAAGKPVLGWRTPDLAEIVEDGDTGLLLPPGDKPQQLSAKTHNVLGDPALAARLGAAGRLRGVQHFGVAHAAEQLARLYAELA